MEQVKWISLSSDKIEESIVADKKVLQMGFGETKILYKLHGVEHRKSPFGQEGHDLFDLPEAGHTEQPGAPMLIKEGLFVAVPPNAGNIRVTSKIINTKVIKGQYNIIPCPEDVFETEEYIFEQNHEAYRGVFPEESVEYHRLTNIMGVDCVHIFVYPLQYNIQEKAVVAFTEIELTTTYEHTPIKVEAQPINVNPSRFTHEQ